jgi:hypothetical protein
MKTDQVIHKSCNVICIHETCYIAMLFNKYGKRTTAEAIIYKHNTKKQQQQEDENEDPKHSHNDINQKGNLEVADKILWSDFVLHNPTLPEELRNDPEGAEKYESAIIITAVPYRKLVQDDIFTKTIKY